MSSKRMDEAKKTAVALGLDQPEPAAEVTRAEGPAEMRPLEVITQEIAFYKRQAGGAIIEIGKRLIEAKEQMRHGEWLPWLRERVDISERSAQDFMRLAREYSKSAEIADLGACKALALLALPESERESFSAEPHLVGGEEKAVADMTAEELRTAIRERNEAREAAERARAEAAAAEESRGKMEQDMAALKEMQQRAKETEETQRQELERIQQELKELRERPVDVAVEKVQDPEALAAARAEGAQEARTAAEAEIRKREEDLEKARDALKAAKAAAKEAEGKLSAYERRSREAEAAAEKARKAAEVNSNKDLAAFGVLFDQTQGTVNRMADLLQKVGEEDRKKLRKALNALAEAIQKAAGEDENTKPM